MNRPGNFVVAFLLVGLGASFCATAGNESARFSFGSDKPAPGLTQVSSATIYDATNGFGLEPGARVMAGSNFVTSDGPFQFSVKLPEGNYSIAAILGSSTGESVTTVKAEARRLMLENVRVAKGESVARSFTVNVRTPRIGTNSEVRLKPRERVTEMITWDDKLTLEFNGLRPSVRALEITPAPDVPTVFLAGDSTVTDQPNEPWGSWGQMLTRFFKPGVAVANYAESGESIKSSLSARRFEKIFDRMKPGDWLLIQFGHNDMKDRATNALATYEANLKQIVGQTRAKGGAPVLITSPERKAGVITNTLAAYPDTVRRVAREEQVALIDLNTMSKHFYAALGEHLDKAFGDGAHHVAYGSYELAKCVVEGIRGNRLPLVRFLVDDVPAFDPGHPDPIERFDVPASAAAAAKPEGN